MDTSIKDEGSPYDQAQEADSNQANAHAAASAADAQQDSTGQAMPQARGHGGAAGQNQDVGAAAGRQQQNADRQRNRAAGAAAVPQDGANQDMAESQDSPDYAQEYIQSEFNNADLQMEKRVRVADLPYDDKVKELKSYWETMWTTTKEGDYLDAYDSVQKWCLAQIIDKDDTSVRLHFDGWSSKWDVTYRLTSYKIAPFRKYSRGYSGQSKVPFRNNLNFSLPWLEAQMQRLEEVLSTDFECLSAKETTQYLRGEFFIAVDFVMTSNTYTEEVVVKVNEFIKAAIRLIVAWLRKAGSLLQKCLPLIRQDPDLFLVDEDVALLQSAHEVMGILKRLFCGDHKALRIYLHYDSHVEQFANSITKDHSGVDFPARTYPLDQDYDIDEIRERITSRADDLVFGSALNFLNYFNELDGFTILMNLIKAGNYRPTDEEIKEDKSKAEIEMIPLETFVELTGSFLNCAPLMNEQFAADFVQQVEEIFTERLMGMRDNEIKELDKDIISSILKSFRQFLSIAKEEEGIAELIEKIQISFAARFLKTTYLEKRLKGVGEIRSIIEKVDARTTLDRQYKKAQEMGAKMARRQTYMLGQGGVKIRPTQFLSSGFLKSWLLREKVAETIFGEGAHDEILKRSGPILRFLSQHGALEEDIVGMVWRCQQGKHEETVRVVYGLISEVIDHLPVGHLQFLFAKILEVPESQYSEMHLLFVKDFTLRALQANENNAYRQESEADENQEANNANQIHVIENKVFSDLQAALDQPEQVGLAEGQHLYGLPVLWKIVQDQYTRQSDLEDSEILKIALDSLCEILTQPCARCTRMYFLLLAINNLRSGASLYPSISIAVSIIEGFDLYVMGDYQQYKLSSSQALELLEKQIGLVDIILQDITLYDQHVKEAMKGLIKKNINAPDNVENYIFSGRTGHHTSLAKLFELLEFVVLNSNWAVTIKTQNIDTLWKLLVLSPNFQQDQNLFLQFINRKRTRQTRYQADQGNYANRQTQIVYLFTPEEQKHLFTQILCNPTFIDFQSISLGQTKCFHTYFRLINIQEGYIEQYRRRKMEVIDFTKLIGLDTLWRISFESGNEKVRDESRELLIDLHLRLTATYGLEQKRKILKSFIERSMSVLAQASQNIQDENAQHVALAVVETLAEFLNRYEGKKPIRPEMKTFAMQYQHFAPWTITVIYKRDGSAPQGEGKIQVSHFQSLGQVRHDCAACFGLEQNEFHLSVKNALVDPDEDDDRYVREHGMSQHIFLTPNPLYDKMGHPKYTLAQNQDYFDLLFSLLAKSSPHLLEPVWELLQKLPVNAKLLEDISNLEGASEDWNSLLDSTSTHKLLYSLKIIEGLKNTIRPGRQDKEEADSAAIQSPSFPPKDIHSWKEKFIQLGGFSHLLDTFTGLGIDDIDSKLTLRCIENLLGSLLEFVQINNNLQEEIISKRQQVVLSCLRYIHMIGQYTLVIEKQRGDSFEDIEAKKLQKKLAKQKMKQQQMSALGKNLRGKTTNDDDSEDEDETGKVINQILREFSEVKNVIEKLFSFMNHFIFLKDKSALGIIENYINLKDMIMATMLLSENMKVREEAGRQINKIIVSCSGQPALTSTITSVLQVLLVEILPIVEEHEPRCEEYFDLVRRVIEELKATDLEPLERKIWELIQYLTNDVLARESKEVTTKTKDRILMGVMTVLSALLQKYPARKQEIGVKLTAHLLHDCLFEVPHGSTQAEGAQMSTRPKCKSMTTRRSALSLLSVLSRDCLDNLNTILVYIKDFGKQASWRTNKTSDWSITHQDDEKSSTGYVGLKNLGCICYMISFFQQLYMVPSFRSDILNVEDPNHDNQESSENMFYQFQAIFMGLLKSEKQYVNPKGFCHAFKDWEGQPTNVLEQMDVEEFYNMFMDRLETAIKGTPPEKTIQEHFGGKFANEMICKDCPHRYERSEPFLAIGVSVKNKRSIQDGLTAFIQGDMLEGDNAYFCEKCDKKIDTLKRTCVKELPRYLVITLKRFEFDFDRMVRVKVNDYYEFPLELNMLPYTQEHLKRKEQAAKKAQEAAEKGEAIEETEEEPLKHPKDYYEYKLKGVVVHTGTADSGHYYSFIREHATSDGEKWYEFNDNIVQDFDIGDLANECFGGEDSFLGQGLIQMKTQKWRNAYLVLYERKNQQYKLQEDEDCKVPKQAKPKDPKAEDQQMIIDESDQAKQPKLNDPDHPIQEKIRLENQKYWQNKFLFGNEYFEFVDQIIHYWDTGNIVPLKVLNKNADSHIVNFDQRQPYTNFTAYNTQFSQEIPLPRDEVFDLRPQHPEEIWKIESARHEIFKFGVSFYLTIIQRAQHKALVPKIINALKSYLNSDVRNGEWLLTQFSNWDIMEEMILQTLDVEMPKLTVGLLYCAMITVYEKEKASLNEYWKDVQYDEQGTPIVNRNEPHSGTLGHLGLMLVHHIYDLKQFSYNMPHYFQILARFASLGPEAREFLLRAKIVGRCMDFFFDNVSPYRKHFSNMSDLGYLRNVAKPELGLPTQVDKKVRTYFQLLQEKRRKQQLQSANPKYKYLMELVSLCVRHLRIGVDKTTQYQLDIGYPGSMTTFVKSQEADIFIPEAKFLKRFFVEAKRNRSLQNIVKAHIHYAYFDNDQVEELFQTVEAGLKTGDYDYDRIRPFLGLFEQLLSTNHPNFTTKMSQWLARFLQAVEANAGYHKWMEVIYDFVFKITSRNAAVRQWFYNNQPAWRFLVDWASINKVPPHPAQPSHTGVRLFKNRQNLQLAALQSYNDPNTQSRNALNFSYRARKMKELLAQRTPDLTEEPDIDRIDLQDFKFVPGDLVTLVGRKLEDGAQWRVIAVLDELVSITCMEPDQTGKQHTKWQKKDTDKLLFGETFQKLHKSKVKQELIEQREQQRLQQQAEAAAQRDGGQGGQGREGKSGRVAPGGSPDGDAVMQDQWQAKNQQQNARGGEKKQKDSSTGPKDGQPSPDSYGESSEDEQSDQ